MLLLFIWAVIAAHIRSTVGTPSYSLGVDEQARLTYSQPKLYHEV